MKKQLFKPEGKRFSYLPESEIKTEFLEAIPAPSVWQLIETIYPEFSAVCPESGLPDIATVEISYIPVGSVILEMKALKYYLVSFRSVGIMQENVTKRIYDDLLKILNMDPSLEALKVVTRYNTRGGIDQICTEGKCKGL